MRYAIYYTPEKNHPLTETAASWLGRSAFGGDVAPLTQSLPWSQNQQHDLVENAAHYGFHATLKAPFTLEPNCDEAALVKAFSTFEIKPSVVVIPTLALRQIDGYFALVPEPTTDIIQDFATRIVRHFDEFRAPLNTADLARRTRSPLNDKQRDYLDAWGYPYVFDEFLFHMTLTDRVPAEHAHAVRAVLEKHFEAFIGHPHQISHIALFRQKSATDAFTVHTIRPLVRDQTSSDESQFNEQ